MPAPRHHSSPSNGGESQSGYYFLLNILYVNKKIILNLWCGWLLFALWLVNWGVCGAQAFHLSCFLSPEHIVVSEAPPPCPTGLRVCTQHWAWGSRLHAPMAAQVPSHLFRALLQHQGQGLWPNELLLFTPVAWL